MRVVFESNTLLVYDYTDSLRVHQPFKPTPTGEKLDWESEQEALAWAEEHLNLSQWEAPAEPSNTTVGE